MYESHLIFELNIVMGAPRKLRKSFLNGKINTTSITVSNVTGLFMSVTSFSFIKLMDSNLVPYRADIWKLKKITKG